MSERGLDVFASDELIELLGHDPELLAIADAIAETRPTVGQRRIPRRAWPVAAAILAILLLAIPAVAALTHVIDFGSSPRATSQVVKFHQLDEGAPAGMAPGAIAGEVRALTLPFGERTITLYLSPTRRGGYCFAFASPGAGGCDRDRSLPFAPGIAWARTDEPGLAYAFALDPAAASVRTTVITEKGTAGHSSPAELLTWISQPINAGVAAVQVGPMDNIYAIRLDLLDKQGRQLASTTMTTHV